MEGHTLVMSILKKWTGQLVDNLRSQFLVRLLRNVTGTKMTYMNTHAALDLQYKRQYYYILFR